MTISSLCASRNLKRFGKSGLITILIVETMINLLSTTFPSSTQNLMAHLIAHLRITHAFQFE